MIDYTVISLSELLKNPSLDQKKIESILKKFSCQTEKDLENFLSKNAIQYEKIEFGKTFIILDYSYLLNEEMKIAAFFTIGNTSVDISMLSQKQKKNLLGSVPGRDNMTAYPAFLIGQLGRSDEYSSTELPGHIIIEECNCRLKAAQVIVGGKLVILECREPLRKVYETNGFKYLRGPDEKGLYTYYKRLT